MLYDALFMFKSMKHVEMIFTNMLELIDEWMKLLGLTTKLF